MPEYTDYAKIPIPLWSEADQVPPDLKNAFKVIDPKLVLHATDESDLPSLYPDVPAGTLVVGTDQEAMWIRRQNGTWFRVWSDSGWRTIALKNGWENVSAANPLAYRVIGAVCYWKGVIKFPGDYKAGEWSQIAAVPADAVPAGGFARFPWSTNATVPLSAAILINDAGLNGYTTPATGAWMPCPPPYVVDGA